MKTYEKIIEDLVENKDLKIVEGRKDKEALEKLGVSKIKTLKGPISQFISKINERIIILVDCDEKGEKITQEIVNQCEQQGLKYDLEFRRKICKVFGIKKFEEIYKKMEKLEGEYG
ncbi:MAG: toprim domain-containing protein [archaeon]